MILYLPVASSSLRFWGYMRFSFPLFFSSNDPGSVSTSCLRVTMLTPLHLCRSNLATLGQQHCQHVERELFARLVDLGLVLTGVLLCKDLVCCMGMHGCVLRTSPVVLHSCQIWQSDFTDKATAPNMTVVPVWVPGSKCRQCEFRV